MPEHVNKKLWNGPSHQKSSKTQDVMILRDIMPLAEILRGWAFIFGIWKCFLFLPCLLSRSFNSWFWLVAILGFGSRYINFNNEILKYTREAVLPFYILHQTAIVTIGFYMADLKMGVMVKYLMLSTLSFVVIIAVYDLLISRFNALRFLFGLKAKR